MGGVRLSQSSSTLWDEKLQWGPPGMGGVSSTAPLFLSAGPPLQWGPPGMGGVSGQANREHHRRYPTSMGTSRNGRCEACPVVAATGPRNDTSMGTSRNGRCELNPRDRAALKVLALQWGPPGMGGVRRG